MTVSVVDGFEVIEIHHQTTQVLVLSKGQGDGPMRLFLERPSGQRASQAIFVGERPQLELVGHQAGQIPEDLNLLGPE